MSEKERLLGPSTPAPADAGVLGMGFGEAPPPGNNVVGSYGHATTASAPPAESDETWSDAPAPPKNFRPEQPQSQPVALPPVVFDTENFTPDDAKAAAERWAQSTFFKRRDYMREVDVDDFKMFNAYVSTLDNFVEYRKLSPAERPYRGGHVDSGFPPGPWEVIQPPTVYFENRKITMPLPRSERVDSCHHCHGRGQKQCHDCHGVGRHTCSHCQGRGLVEHVEFGHDHHHGHRQTTHTPHVHHHHDQCHRCAGSGQMQCHGCHGCGMTTCHRCDGTGQLVLYTELRIEWCNISTQSVVKDIFDPELTAVLPDSKLARGDGPVLLAEQAWMLQPAYGNQGRINPAVNAAIDRLLHDANQPAPRAQHQQRLIVRGLPVYELAYHAQDQHPRRLWVFGTDRKVHAPEYPLSTGRVLALVGSIIFIVIGVALLLVFFLYLLPNNIV